MYFFAKIQEFRRRLRIERWPKKNQWKQLWKVLTKKERIIVSISSLLIIISLITVGVDLYWKNTAPKPAQGGHYIEGVVGQPRFINPVYANSDVDRDLTQLVFSGLLKYDSNLQIVTDLAERYEVQENGKVYRVYLKKGLLWQDGTPLTSDDVLFTIKTIQNPDFKSPFRANWLGVNVERTDDVTIVFTLDRPYSAFPENLTAEILPKHIWQNVTPENFPLEIYNLKPVGSGPYRFKEIQQDRPGHTSSLSLVPNAAYQNTQPLLSEVKFLFFDDAAKLLDAARKRKVTAFSPDTLPNFAEEWKVYSMILPRYFAVFFNPDQSKVLSEKGVRQALNYATDKQAVVEQILDAQKQSSSLARQVVSSPLLPDIYGLKPPQNTYDFNLDKAKSLLDTAGYKDFNQDGIREKAVKRELAFQFKSNLTVGSKGKEVEELQRCLMKFPDLYPNGSVTGSFDQKTKSAVIKFQEKYADEILKPQGFTEGTGLVSKGTRNKLNTVCLPPPQENIPLQITLATVDQPMLQDTANILKEQWKQVGVDVEIKALPILQLEQEIIKPRSYDALLFGEVLGAIPDPLPFWHSSQTKDPGLNLAGYSDSKVDDLLQDIRNTTDPGARADKLSQLQDMILDDAPAVFLYSPGYLYLVSNKVQGIDLQKISEPSKRFTNIENWFIKTKRVWK